MFDPTQSIYDQLNSRPKHPTLHSNHERTPTLQLELASDEGNLTSPPTRAHWIKDEIVTNCTSCTIKFNLILRKHHCRKCGQIFCGECSKYTGKLDSIAHFNPLGYICRLCSSCHQQFIIFLDGKPCSDKGLVDSPSTADLVKNSTSTITKIENHSPDQGDGPSPAVPSDWQWSTF